MACSLYGEERLVTPVPGTRFASWVAEPFVGMHFCNFAPTAAVVQRLEAAGVVVGATAPDAGAEVLEFPDHPFYVTSMFQPHVGALAGAPVHPLVTAFTDAVGAPSVREGEPSRTAWGAAVHRAVHPVLDHPVLFDDPLAFPILGADRDELLASVPPRSRLRMFIALRHRLAEQALAAAYDRGTRQCVVLGAGLDTIAYRNDHADLRVFEVDHPATQAWKRERLAEAGIAEAATYVGVDFERDDLTARLVEDGFDATRPAVFVWLGVVPYLTRAAVAVTLRAIAASPGRRGGPRPRGHRARRGGGGTAPAVGRARGRAG